MWDDCANIFTLRVQRVQQEYEQHRVPWQINSNATLKIQEKGFTALSAAAVYRMRPESLLTGRQKENSVQCGAWGNQENYSERYEEQTVRGVNSVRDLLRGLKKPCLFWSGSDVFIGRWVPGITKWYSCTISKIKYFFKRVWSWLRMNAGGVLNTCKSNGRYRRRDFGQTGCIFSGGRVSNAWVTCLTPGDNT